MLFRSLHCRSRVRRHGWFCCKVGDGFRSGYDWSGGRGRGRRRGGLQGAAFYWGGDPVGGALIPDVSDELPRPRTDADGSGRGGRAHDHLPLDLGLRRRAGEAVATASALEQRLLASGRGLHQGQGPLDLPVSSGRQPGPDHRLPALGQAGCRGGEAVRPQSARLAAHGEPAYHHGRQERRLSQGRCRDEGRRHTMAAVPACSDAST